MALGQGAGETMTPARIPQDQGPQRLIIASRESRLALWQAHHVRDRLAALYPGCAVEILGMTTEGDRVLDRSLSRIGGKGLFVKELEAALADGRADLAVHSAKDVPMQLPEGFRLSAILEREDPRDCLVSGRFDELEALPAGARVGSSSLRREAQLRERFPGVSVAPVRGNVETRLAKLDRGEFDALLLAAAGLKRLGLAHRIRSLIEPEISLPAPGQGALAIECLAGRDDLHAWLKPLHHADTAACVLAERAVSRALAGSCQVPLAAHALMRAGGLWLRGLVATPDGERVVRAELRGSVADPERDPELLGERLAALLRERGAQAVLASLDTPNKLRE
jgi:hydroxymethylbilane synthase